MGSACCADGEGGNGIQAEPEPEGEDMAHFDRPPSPTRATPKASRYLLMFRGCCSGTDEANAQTVDVLKSDPVYNGEWVGEHWHGKGHVDIPGQYEYEGAFQLSQAHGHGTSRGADSTIYEGQWYRGRRHGYGVFIHQDGTVYTGSWQDDEKAGKGVENWMDGTSYRGEFFHGMRHGTGKYKSSRGKYEGQFRNDKMEGQGKYDFTSGRAYVGQWQDGVFLGHGTMEMTDGSKYDGNYEGGVRSGTGTMTWPDGRVYHGEWSNNGQNGLGVMTSKDGNKVGGVWKEGALIEDQDIESVEMKPAEGKPFKWTVLMPVHVRALPSKEAESVGTKERGAVVKGYSVGGWLALQEEVGFVAIRSNGNTLLTPVVPPKQK